MCLENRSKTICMRVKPSVYSDFRVLGSRFSYLSDADLFEFIVRLFQVTGTHTAVARAMWESNAFHKPVDEKIILDLSSCHTCQARITNSEVKSNHLPSGGRSKPK